MSKQDGKALIPYLKETAGEYLRGVVWYEDTE